MNDFQLGQNIVFIFFTELTIFDNRKNVARCNITKNYTLTPKIDINRKNHGLLTPNESFFFKYPKYFGYFWADRPKKLWDILGYFG